MLGIELVGGRWHRLMMARGTQLTYDDFAALPDDGKHYELGEVFFAPFDVILSEHDEAEPDILVVASPSQFRNAASRAAGAGSGSHLTLESPIRPCHKSRTVSGPRRRALLDYRSKNEARCLSTPGARRLGCCGGRARQRYGLRSSVARSRDQLEGSVASEVRLKPDTTYDVSHPVGAHLR